MRNLANCLVGGQILGLFIAQVLFLVNPHVALSPINLGRTWAVLAVTYGLGSALALWFLLYLLELLTGSKIRPAWLSFRLLIWLLMLDLAAAAAVAWHNSFYYRLYLPSDAVRAIVIVGAAFSAAAAMLLVLGLFHYSFGRRGMRVSYVLALATATASLATPFFVRLDSASAAPVPRLPLRARPLAQRVTIVGVEGASMSYVLPAVAEGKLPNFARLIENGASGALKTLYPTESLAVWTSMATGKLPRQHGLTEFYRYRFPGVQPPWSLLPHGLYLHSLERFGLMRRAAVTSVLRRSETFWSILSSFGVRLGVVRWWGTYPAEPVEGFIVSEWFHRQVQENLDPPLPDLTYPPDLFGQLSAYVVRPEDIDSAELNRYVDTSVDITGPAPSWESTLRKALAEDHTYHRAGRALREIYDPQVYAIYFFGLDTVGHLFFRYHQPEDFGDVSDVEIEKFGRAIEAYYGCLDAFLGEYLQSRRPEEILLVVSGHGMEPLPLARRVFEAVKGDPQRFGFHDNAPDGLVIFHGPGIARGAKIQGASVVDITPTLLYLMGLPLGQDMEGTLLAGMLEKSPTRGRSVTFISSYQNFLIQPRPEGGSDHAPSPLDSLPGVLDVRE